MKKLLFVFVIIASGITACKKENVEPAPAVSFAVDSDTAKRLSTIGVYDMHTLSNTSTNTYTVLWDLGNGVTSKEKQIDISYPKAGNYTITLTATNRAGKSSVSSMKIKVVEPVLKQVEINSVNWYPGSGGGGITPTGDKVDVWVEIVQAAPNTNYPYLITGTFDAPVVYKSSVIPNVTRNSSPIVFNLASRMTIDIPTLLRRNDYKGLGYGINLYAQDAFGVYLLNSTFWGGAGLSYLGSYSPNQFEIRALNGSIGCRVILSGVYE